MEQPLPTFQSFDDMLSKFASDTPPANPTLDPAKPAGTPPADQTPPAAQNPPAAQTPPAQTAPAQTPPADQTPPAAQTPPNNQPFDPSATFGGDKQNAAFAAMRVTNSAMQKTLNRIAETLGIDSRDPEAMIQALERQLNEHQAKEQNIPLEVLERMDKLTRDAEQRERESRVTEANRGFQRVKDEFKLDNAGLQAFANKLREAGKNPFETPMDLVTEYKILNYEALMTKAKEDAAAAALQRQQHGQQHSTQPGTAAPAGTPGSAKPVNSVQELEVLLKDFQ